MEEAGVDSAGWDGGGKNVSVMMEWLVGGWVRGFWFGVGYADSVEVQAIFFQQVIRGLDGVIGVVSDLPSLLAGVLPTLLVGHGGHELPKLRLRGSTGRNVVFILGNAGVGGSL